MIIKWYLLTGEILLGGACGFTVDSEVRFGRIFPVNFIYEEIDKKIVYNLEHVINNYTITRSDHNLALTISDLLAALEIECNLASECCCVNILALTIIISRLKIMGYDFDNNNDSHNDTLDKVMNICEASIQKRYLALLIAKYLNPITTIGICDIETYSRQYLSGRKFIDRIQQDEKINFKEIYENPWDNNLNRFVDFMNSFATDKNLFILKETLSENYKEQTVGPEVTKDDGVDLCRVMNVSGCDYCVLSFLLNQSSSTIYMFDKDVFNKQIACIDKNILFMKEFVENKDSADHSMLEDSDEIYPLVFVMDKPELVVLKMHITQEYEAKRAVKLGKDIEIIATDTLINQKRLNVFLDTNREKIGSRVTTCLFKDLLKIQEKIFTLDQFKKYADGKYADRLTGNEVEEANGKSNEKNINKIIKDVVSTNRIKETKSIKLNMKHAFSYSWHKYRFSGYLIQWFHAIKAILQSFFFDFTVSQDNMDSVINSFDKSLECHNN